MRKFYPVMIAVLAGCLSLACQDKPKTEQLVMLLGKKCHDV